MKHFIVFLARFVKKHIFRQPLRSEMTNPSCITPGGLPAVYE
jgi:hypothetical protein